MTTIVNSPAPANNDNNNGGLLVAIFGLIVLGFLFFYFGLPALRKMGTPQINIPAPEVNIPNEIDVNINQTP